MVAFSVLALPLRSIAPLCTLIIFLRLIVCVSALLIACGDRFFISSIALIALIAFVALVSSLSYLYLSPYRFSDRSFVPSCRPLLRSLSYLSLLPYELSDRSFVPS